MRLLLTTALSALIAACATTAPRRPLPAPSPPSAPGAVGGEGSRLLVDPAAPERPDADGSKARPFRRIGDALAQAKRGEIVQLGIGLYPGAVTVPPEVRLEGARASVLYVEVGEVAIRMGRGSALKGLSVQGGEVGVLVEHGDVSLDGVFFSGQRKVAVQLNEGVHARLSEVDIEGTVSETVGVTLAPHAAADLTGCRLHGALRTGIYIQPRAGISIFNSRFEGPATAIKMDRGAVRARHLSIWGGRGAALWLSGGQAALDDVTIHGHEYGILANAGLKLDVRGFVSVRAERTAMGLFEVTAKLFDVTSLDAGNYGGLQFIGSDITLNRFLVARAKEYGISVIRGRAQLHDGTILDVEDTTGYDGDGLIAREAKVEARLLTVFRGGGSAVVATQFGSVALTEAYIDRAKSGGLLAENSGQLDAVSVIIHRSGTGALIVPEQALIRADVLSTHSNADGLLWAECARGAEVLLGRVHGAEAHLGTRGACVGQWGTPRVLKPSASPELPATP